MKRLRVHLAKRKIGSVLSTLDEVFFLSDDSKQGNFSAWRQAIPIAITTGLINIIGFSLFSFPQAVFRVIPDATDRLRRDTLSLEMLEDFQKFESEQSKIQHDRISELPSVSLISDGGPYGFKLNDLQYQSRQNQLTIARDSGKAASYISIGLEWGREWAKAQVAANLAEVQAWRSCQELAESLADTGHSAVNVRHSKRTYEEDRLKLISAISEVDAYRDHFTMVGTNQVQQLKVELASLQGEIDTVPEVLKLCRDAMGISVLLFLCIGVSWLAHRLQKVTDERQKRTADLRLLE